MATTVFHTCDSRPSRTTDNFSLDPERQTAKMRSPGGPGGGRRDWGGLLGLSPAIFGIEECPPALAVEGAGRGPKVRTPGLSPSSP